MQSQNVEYENVLPPQNGILWIFIVLAGLILPILLIPIVKLTGHTEVVEEVSKALIVLFLILKLSSSKMQILAGAILGLLFGLSESMLYLTNIFQLGDFGIFWQRFLWTVPMHIVTVLIMVCASLWKRQLLIFGFGGAVVLHTVFNSMIVNLLV